MNCPEGLKPWRTELRTNKPMPMFVPPEMLSTSRAQLPGVWIEPMPDLPLNGCAISHAEWLRVLQDSSKSL
jgi:hypothetical protein